MMKFYFFLITYLISFSVNEIHSHIPTELETIACRNRLDALELFEPKCLSLPEGGFVYYYHPDVGIWLEQSFNADLLKNIEEQLRASLEIPFTKEGFTQAVAKAEGDQFGEVSYSAIWVRDCCWHYYGLKIHHPQKAARLILNLLDFYSSDQQMTRFLSIIDKPELADPDITSTAHMNVPLIRFSSKTLSHHQVEGEDQEWNHFQFDSHGLFLLALSDALSSGIVSSENLSQKNFAVLALFPAFFTQTNYSQKADAGPWEERLQYNASSAGLVAAGIKRIMEVLNSTPTLRLRMQEGITLLKNKANNVDLIDKIESGMAVENIQNLYQCGLKRVERNLSFGGEAPNLDGNGMDRRADTALLFLGLVEHTPFFDHPEKIKEILNINSSLVGPYGIYRYRYDPYQAFNYWGDFDKSSPISGAKTPLFEKIDWWKKGYQPCRQSSDAQWFFDSCFAELYYHISMMEEEPLAKAYYLKHGDIHLKRALAQLTGPSAYAANGGPLEALQLPESINTVESCGKILPLPSPISPLSWAKASMQMALTRAQAAHSQFEQSNKQKQLGAYIFDD